MTGNLTWPVHLGQILSEYTHVPTGMASVGNGIISRRVIYTVSQLLKQHPADDILVGIMWSGPSRHDYYTTEIPEHLLSKNTSPDGNPGARPYGIDNPTRIAAEKNWVIMNHSWVNSLPSAEQYYRYFYDHIGSLVYTYEHILRTQWFLKLHNIRYFMSAYKNEVFPPDTKNHNEITHLLDQIDADKFLPVDGEYEWCRDYSGLPFDIYDHPTQEQHKLFVEQILHPFLLQKQLL
jgi:hypothetical protein